MKLVELLHKMDGVDSYGLYTRTGQVIKSHPTIQDLMGYLKEEVHHFKVWIYDDTDINIQGDKFDVKRIRCCIYLERGTEDTFSDINLLSKGLYDDVTCPYCGAKHFALGYGITTAVYCPTIIKDGKVIDNDCNSTTYKCTCCECHREFTIDGHNKVSKIPRQENICIMNYSNHKLEESR